MQISREQLLPTGNDVVSIPGLSAADASSPMVSVLSMKYRGPVAWQGSDKAPFFKPSIRIAGKAMDLGREKLSKAARLEHWIPEYSLSDPKSYALQLKVVAPVGARGFLLDYSVKNLGTKALKVGLGAQGCFGGLRAQGGSGCNLNLWREASVYQESAARYLVFSAGAAAPEFAMAIGATEDPDLMEVGLGAASKGSAKGVKASADSGKGLHWQVAKNFEIKPGEALRFGILFGLGTQAQAAAASCLDFKRQGLPALVDATLRFLNRKVRFTGDSHLDQLMNLNQWFNYFFAMGTTLDTEDFVCLSSRAPRDFLTGAFYSDREAMLWSFPALLAIDTQRARHMLEYAFGIQGRNFGAPRRFIDGTLLEPGFDLGGLCAPVIALANYVKNTGDQSLLKDFGVRRVIRGVEKTLQGRKHATQALYEARSPSESGSYLTFDNVLAWRTQQALAELKPRMGRDQDVAGHKELAERIKSAIWKQLTADGQHGRMFVWSSDLKGRHHLGTEPEGCLQLLPYFGFCEFSEGVWRNSTGYLHSKEYAHSFAGQPFDDIGPGGQPSVLSLCNRLLSGQKDKAKALLDRMDFDGGVMCRSFDPRTGKPVNGWAFAAGAGFMAWAIWKAFGRVEGVRVIQGPAPSPGTVAQPRFTGLQAQIPGLAPLPVQAKAKPSPAAAQPAPAKPVKKKTAKPKKTKR